MQRFFIPKKHEENMTITGMDAHHIIDVLRMKKGDKVQIVADDGVSAVAEITELNGNAVGVKTIEILRESHEPAVKIVLFQGLAKGEKMDFIIQKAVELGVEAIYPIAMEHSVVKLEKDKAGKKNERWQKIAEAAAKQSKRDIIPKVHEVMDLNTALAKEPEVLKILAYESENKVSLKQLLQGNPTSERMGVIIGPEGGISEKEVAIALANGATAVSLGRRILRAETAGIVAMAAIYYETGDLGL